MTRTFSLFTHVVLATTMAQTGKPHAPPSGIANPPTAHAQAEAKPAATTTAAAKPAATTTKAADAKPDAKPDEMHPVGDKDLAAIKALNEKYRKSSSITSDVAKQVKLGFGGADRKSAGKLELSKGQIRMELEGSDHTLLVANKKTLFVVTYPDKALKGAALQVIKADVSNKKAQKKTQSSALANLLGPGGFLKSFKPVGVMGADEKTYFLQPLGDQNDMTRAQLKVANKEIRELKYWDAVGNETSYTFSNVKFGAKLDAKIFDYTPPADADVMNL